MRGLSSPLYVVCDAAVCERAGWTLVDFAAACLEAGARLLQVRAKGMSGGALLKSTVAVVQLAHVADARVLVNDRADIARLACAGGVHVGQEDLPPASVRALVGPDSIVGLSTHEPQQLEAAMREPVDYVALGPVFATSTKATEYDAVGLERLRDACSRAARAGFPLVAIGGITLERAPSVIDAGAQAVAVVSDLLATGDPAARVRQFLAALR